MFKEVQNCNINVFNPNLITKYGEEIKIPSTKFWYARSLDFDTIGKFWKSNITKLDKYFNNPETIETNKRLDNRPDTIFFLYWLNHINIYTNFV